MFIKKLFYVFVGCLTIGFAEEKVYVTNARFNNLAVIDGDTDTVILTFPIIANAQNLAISADGTKAYAPGFTGGTAFNIIDLTTNTIIATVSVGSQPFGLGVFSTQNKLYVGNVASANVSVVDLDSNTVIGTITVGTNPQQIALSPDEQFAYVPNRFSNNVSVIDTSTDTVVVTIPLVGDNRGAAVSADGSKAYISQWDLGRVIVFDTNTHLPINTITVGTGPFIMQNLFPDGSKLYILNSLAPSISVLDPTTDTLVATIPSIGFTFHIAFTQEPSKAYVTTFDLPVQVIDTTTDTVIGTVLLSPAGSCSGGGSDS